MLRAGAAWVVLGTAALADPALIEALVDEHGERIVVAADSRAGRVAVEGWERETPLRTEELVADLARRGVRRFVFTPVEVDGTLRGPALDWLRGGRRGGRGVDGELVYSGGIGASSTCARSPRSGSRRSPG